MKIEQNKDKQTPPNTSRNIVKSDASFKAIKKSTVLSKDIQRVTIKLSDNTKSVLNSTKKKNTIFGEIVNKNNMETSRKNSEYYHIQSKGNTSEKNLLRDTSAKIFNRYPSNNSFKSIQKTQISINSSRETSPFLKKIINPIPGNFTTKTSPIKSKNYEELDLCKFNNQKKKDKEVKLIRTGNKVLLNVLSKEKNLKHLSIFGNSKQTKETSKVSFLYRKNQLYLRHLTQS